MVTTSRLREEEGTLFLKATMLKPLIPPEIPLIQELTPFQLHSKIHPELLSLDLDQSLGNIAMGGRLHAFVDNWEIITQDPWILQVVKGYHLELIEL